MIHRLAAQEEIARAFGHHVATPRRWEHRFQQKGIGSLKDSEKRISVASVLKKTDEVAKPIDVRLLEKTS